MARRVVLWSVACLTIVGASAAYLYLVFNVMFWGGKGCRNEFVREFQSPDNTAIVIAVTNSGATDDYATTASFKSEPDEAYFFSVKGWNTIDVVWTKSKDMPRSYEPTIMHEALKRVFRKAVVWRGTNISYRETEARRDPGGPSAK